MRLAEKRNCQLLLHFSYRSVQSIHVKGNDLSMFINKITF